jgi:hypothetical protein
VPQPHVWSGGAKEKAQQPDESGNIAAGLSWGGDRGVGGEQAVGLSSIEVEWCARGGVHEVGALAACERHPRQ